MRTTLVNPANPRTARRTRGGVIVVRANGAMANPRKRRRRRNAAPLIMPNPRRSAARRPVVVVANPRRRSARRSTIVVANPRRRRRRNPNDMSSTLKNVAVGGGAALASYVINRYVIADWFHKESESAVSEGNRRGMLMRAGVRAVLAGLSAYFLPGTIGAAGMGAFLYPAVHEVHKWWETRPGTTLNPTTNTPVQADLEADLNAALYGSY